jgi:hypothetical protein
MSSIFKYSFKSDRLQRLESPLFKLTDSYGLFCTDEFHKLVDGESLTGLVFQPLWSE